VFSAKYNLRPEKSKYLRKHDTWASSTVNELLLMDDFKTVSFILCVCVYVYVCLCVCARARTPVCVFLSVYICVCVCFFCEKQRKVNYKYSNVLENRGEFRTFGPVFRTSYTFKQLILLYKILYFWNKETHTHFTQYSWLLRK
jgi:hypothetical protein